MHVSVPDMQIEGRFIGPGHAPYCIAELSGNHNGDLQRALALIDAAAEAGADAVKLQTYTADTITIDVDRPEFKISGGLWDGRSLHELYQEAATPWDWHEALFSRARERGVQCFSSPFDPTAIDLLESLGAPAYKIASFELVDTPLIERVAATGKPIIMSTGIADYDEIGAACRAAAAAQSIALLHCVSEYPAAPRTMRLGTLARLRERYGVTVGLSDHTLGSAVSVAAVALGASIIEKHITLDRADGGPDAGFSLEPAEFKQVVDDCRVVFEANGEALEDRSEVGGDNACFRRSLYVVADVAQGQVLSEANVRSIRPGYGLPPSRLASVHGSVATRDLRRGEALAEDMFEGPAG